MIQISRELSVSRIPYRYWNINLELGKNWPGETKSWKDTLDLISAVQEHYNEGNNFIVTRKSQQSRMEVLSWIAQSIMSKNNLFSRVPGETKFTSFERIEPAPGYDGKPFKVKMMKVEELIQFKKQCDREEEEDRADPGLFLEEIKIPDFLFMAEVGSESVNTFTARLIMDVLQTRLNEGLPTVVSICKKISDIKFRDEAVYRPIAEIIQGFFKVSL